MRLRGRVSKLEAKYANQTVHQPLTIVIRAAGNPVLAEAAIQPSDVAVISVKGFTHRRNEPR